MPERVFGEWLDELPNIKKIMDQGCYAKLNSTIPPVSIAAWSSITTGKSPANHGVFECLYLNKNIPGKMNLSSSLNVHGKRIWEITADNGKKAISCFVPLTWPIKPYEGILISGNFTPLKEDIKFTHPPGIKNEINSCLDKPFLMDIKNFRDLSKKEIADKIKEVTQIHLEVMKYLIGNKDWDFFFGVITGSDRMNHSFWKYCDPLHRKYDLNSEFKNTLKEYYKFLDNELGKLIELLDENTKIIILSDHGITRMHTRINLSDWLIKEDYLVLKEDIKINQPIRLESSMIDWNKTKVFATGAYDGQIFINLKGRNPSGVVEPEKYDSLIDELEEKLKNIKGDDGSILDTKIFKKKEYFKGECEDSSPDIVIYFDNLEYGANTSLIGNPLPWSPQTAVGSDDAAHSRQGIFIMNNSQQKGDMGEIDILDVAPTILNSLNIPIPGNMIGKVIK